MPTMTQTPATTGTPDPTGRVAAADLRAGQRITIGRYVVQLVADPTPAPQRSHAPAEVLLLVHEAPTRAASGVVLPASAVQAGAPDDGAAVGEVWFVSVGADQLFVVQGGAA